MNKISGLLLIMDDAEEQGGLSFAPDCIVDPGPAHYDLPIILDAAGGKLHNILGHCTVTQMGNVLVYDGQIRDYEHSGLRKEICHLFYPCAVGKIIDKRDGLITRFRVTDVLISMKNSDSRIPHVQMEVNQDKEKEVV